MRKPKTVASLRPLAKKLHAIRFWKDLTQAEMLPVIYPKANRSHRALISQWELAMREPLRHILIRYARLADISLEEIMIDEVPLPAHITRDFKRFGGDIRKKREWEARQKKAASGEPDEIAVRDKNNHETNNKTDDKTVDEIENNENDNNTIKYAENEESVIDKCSGCDDAINRLSLLIGDEPTETATFELPVKTLDRLDDARIKLLGDVPRRKRPSLTLAGIVNVGINVLLVNHKLCEQKSFISKQTQLLIDALK